MIFSRQDFFLGVCNNRQYYSQYLTPRIIAFVDGMIGHEWIINSIHEDFDDIPEKRWEALHVSLCIMIGEKQFITYGDVVSTLNSIQIGKEAARQLREMNKPVEND